MSLMFIQNLIKKGDIVKRVQVFKMDKDQSNILNKVLGIIFIIVAIILLAPYILHFLTITLAVFLIGLGIYFLTKETRFRWFRIRRF
jgi:predicted membrane channel-forming protein YqfA (hemolysin III family)